MQLLPRRECCNIDFASIILREKLSLIDLIVRLSSVVLFNDRIISATMSLSRSSGKDHSSEQCWHLYDGTRIIPRAWYQTFMGIADTLEGLSHADRMIQTVMDGIVRSTGADRVSGNHNDFRVVRRSKIIGNIGSIERTIGSCKR